MLVRNAAGSLTFAVFVPLIADDTGWSRALIGGAAALGGLLATGASPPVGWAVDRFGARVVLVAGIIIIGLSTMAMAWLSVHIAIFYAALAIGRIMFSSPLNVGPATVVGRWFVRQRGRATGFLFLSHSAGMVLFPLVATWVSVVYGWETAWIVLGLMVYVIALGPAALLIAQRPEDVGLLPDGDSPGDTSDGSDAVQAGGSSGGGVRVGVDDTAGTQDAGSVGVGAGYRVPVPAAIWHQHISGRPAAIQGHRPCAVPAEHRGQRGGDWRGQPAVGACGGANARFLHLCHRRAGDGGGMRDIRGRRDGVAGVHWAPGCSEWRWAGILVVPPVAYANFFGRQSLGTIRGVTEPFTSLGQAIGAVASGLVFHFTGGSYVIAFVVYAALGAMTAAALLLARPPRHPSLATAAAVGDPADN